MKSTGYIDSNNVYHRELPDVNSMKNTVASTDKEYSHDRQREGHRRDLLQPFTRDGKPNQEFIQQYPEESKGYGFIK
jgi:hypothetical protein